RGTGGVEDVRGHVVAVGPHTGMRVVDEVHRVGDEVIDVVGAERVIGNRNGDALMGVARAGADDELREDPAAGEEVIADDRIAVIVCGAGSAEGLEEGVASGRPVEQRAGGLVENGEAGVVPLHVLRCTDATVDVGRIAAGAEGAETDADAVETGADGARGRKLRPEEVLDRPVRSSDFGRGNRADRLGMTLIVAIAAVGRRVRMDLAKRRGADSLYRLLIDGRSGVGHRGYGAFRRSFSS